MPRECVNVSRDLITRVIEDYCVQRDKYYSYDYGKLGIYWGTDSRALEVFTPNETSNFPDSWVCIHQHERDENFLLLERKIITYLGGIYVSQLLPQDD